ncbi:MAG: hypothetical protein ACFB5Z_12295 [Elainellaceae cyanobacterium]
MDSSVAQSTFLGTNLTGIADWSTQYPFLDYFKSSRDWITHTDSTWNTKEGDKLRLDEDDWVTSLDGGQFTSVGTLLPNDNQGRRFVVLYEGQGTIQYLDGARKDNAASKPGRDLFYAKPGESLNLRITETDPNGNGNYLRNIRVVPEEYEAIAGTQTFNPDFLKSLEGYQTLRFMDWMDTNNSDQSRWGNRPDADDADYFGEGVPVEVMVELANETGIDPWFTLPHQATDDYVRNFAQYVKANLNPDLKVYVEFSNEVWNGQFEQAQYAREQGKRAFSSGSDYEKAQKWFGQRTGQITQIWDDVFGGNKGRVVGVLGAQAANPNTAEKALEALQSTGKSYQALGIDAIAIAPYFGGYIGSPKHQSQLQSWTRDADGGLGKLFKEITQGGVLNSGPEGGALQLSKDWMTNYARLADKAGLDLVAYEGGQHLVGHSGVENNSAITNLFIKANRDPRIGSAYKQYFENWQAVSDDGAFANYSDIYKANKYGSWGLSESLYDNSAPKLNAVQDILEDTGVAVPGSKPKSKPTADPAPPVPDAPGPAPKDAKNDAEDGPVDVSKDLEVEKDAPAPSPRGEGSEKGSGQDAEQGPDADLPSEGSSDPLRVEAEDMTLNGYRIENSGRVSGRQLISLVGEAQNERGTASQTFEGPKGIYDVVVSYVEETDGVANLEAKLNGKSLDRWQLTQNLGSAAISDKNQVQRTVAAGVALESGDKFELQGQERGDEHARVDYVEFVPAVTSKGDAPAPKAKPPASAPGGTAKPGPDAGPAVGSGAGDQTGGGAGPEADLPAPSAPGLELAQTPVRLSGNALQTLDLDYTITPDTMMQLEFRRGGEGAIQAVGFDQDAFISESDRQNMFKLSGTEDWAVAEDLSDQVIEGKWQTLEIAVGQQVTGDYDYLTLMNIDGGQADVTSAFRNVKLFESPMGAMTSERGQRPFDDAALAENPLAALSAAEDAAVA